MTISPIGREIDRVDGRLKATGQAVYSADYHLDDMAYAYVITSTIALGTIRDMDVAAALDAPGVLDVYRPGHSLGLLVSPPGYGENYAPLEDAKIRHHGQVIAMVVAESFEQARDAAGLITTTYDAQTPTISLADNLPGEPSAGAPNRPAGATHLAPGVSSIDDALAASAVVVRASFHQPIQNHIAMEPHATIATWNAEKTQLTVYSGMQMPAVANQLIAATIGLAPSAIRVKAPYIGGGFGSRVLAWHDVALAAGAAKKLGRPTKLALTREQVFTMTGHRDEVIQTVRLGASRTGVLNAVSHETYAATPKVLAWDMVPATDTSAVLYKTPNLHYDQRRVFLDLPPSCAMRAPNEAPGAFALETAMDELAVATGVDPVELRLRNYASVAPGTDLPWSSKHLDECYRVGAKRFGWSARRTKARARVDGQWLIGMGMATAIYPAQRLPASVRIRLLPDDTAVVSSATSDLGTGAWTVLAITGADSLQIPMRRITPELGDSALPPGSPGVASAGTASTVPSVQAAAADVIGALKQLAVTESRSPWHGADPGGLTYANGRLQGGDHAMTFGRLLTTVGSKGVEATTTTQLDEEVAANFCLHSFGAHFCEVKVNRFTGEPRVTRFTTVVDAGRIVNAQATRSQLVGGVIHGIGYALLESNPIEPDTGRLAASNLADYAVPVNADIPDIDVHWLDRPDTRLNSLGARGLGEIGNVGSAAAVGNAIYNATGIRIRDVPITLDKLLPS